MHVCVKKEERERMRERERERERDLKTKKITHAIGEQGRERERVYPNDVTGCVGTRCDALQCDFYACWESYI